ncbi:Nitrogen fixation protein FixH [Neorhodopirellula lusitana]|uniref:Nitrogen fixation protein FixH n=1 Tax=Neorhodopirellula lusitana TaxID=445327 RepID=A0ABY1Q1U8_9BACT|nr:FixH family protein [Neorhodopirellula lusitana]SMP54510.1 Nitrogen fixation protein FixH [Neorhodopirellula lusitana]
MRQPTGPTKTTDEIHGERRAKRFYIGLVLLLFAIQITILGTAINLAIGDPALAVVPDYHQAALRWDQSKAASRAVQKLGWDVEMKVSDVADGKGLRALQVHATDRDGNSLSNLSINAKVYHHARADHMERIALKSVGDGQYIAMPAMRNPGLWQVELIIDNASVPMTLSQTIELGS